MMQQLAGRRTPRTRFSRMLVARPPRFGPVAERSPIAALTLVVADLVAASAAWSARLGALASAVEPEQLDEPGLAQGFDLGPCRLLLLEPADDTAARDFLRAHGPGLYAILLRDGRRLPPDHAAPFDLLALLPPTLGSHSLN